MTRTLTILILFCASLAFAKQFNLTCDPVPSAAFYTVYVVSQGVTNTTTFSANVFLNVNIPVFGTVAVTETDTNGFESDWSNCLTNGTTAPTNLRKK